MTQHGTVSTEPRHIRVSEIVERHGEPPWSEWLFTDGRNSVSLICDAPGLENDAHLHPDFNEWWIVLQGEFIWEIGDYPPLRARAGDVVICPRKLRHSIKTVGTETSLRLAVSKRGSNHDNKGERSNILKPAPPDQSEPPNLLLSSREALLERSGEPPWSTRLLDDDRNIATLIAHGPGMSNNAHWHPDFNEWWTILKGELTWKVGENRPLIEVREGDIVFVPEGMRHQISTVSDETSLRLAVTNKESTHIYTDDDEAAPPPIE
jgi:quercetin dioxygenase-like cupin family protein